MNLNVTKAKVCAKLTAFLFFVILHSLSACRSNLSINVEEGKEKPEELIYTPGSRVIFSEEDAIAPLMTVDTSLVCRDTSFYNANGDIVQGTRECSANENIEDLKPENIKAEVNIAGVLGTLIEIAEVPELISENLRSGIEIAGVTGSLAAAPEPCVSDGEDACLISSGYQAAATSGLADKVIAGQIVGGISGTIVVPAVGKVLSGTTYGVNGTNATGTLILPSGSNVLAGSGTYGDPNDLITPSFSPDYPDVANVRSSDTVNGASGTLADCSSDGQTTCVANSSYRAIDMSIATAGNIRSGVTIAGQAGDYPSATYPLPSASATADLDSSTFNSQITSATSFEYWGSDGSYYSGSGDADLSAGNILDGISIFGVTGMALAAPCTYGTQGTCEADTACRWNSTNCELNPWNIRNTVTIAGTTGSIKSNCRSRGTSSLYNIDAIPPGNITATDGTTFDWWDTIEPSMGDNSAYRLATEQPDDWSSDHYCGSELWSDITADGACDSAADDCLIRNNVTNLTWSESGPVTGNAASAGSNNWSGAVAHCNGLTFGGHSDWRLPTQMELKAAFAHGLTDLAYKGNGTARPGGDTLANNDFFISAKGSYWSATTNSTSGGQAYNLHLGQSFSNSVAKTGTQGTLCVRQ